MKLSAHKDHEDYHPVAKYIKVLVDGKQESCVISFDTSTGEYTQTVYPFKIIDGELEVQPKQNDSLTFDITDCDVILIQDWYKRELSRRNI